MCIFKTNDDKNLVCIVGDSILNNIDEYGLSDEKVKVRVNKHPGATTEDICDYLKPEIRKKTNFVILRINKKYINWLDNPT